MNKTVQKQKTVKDLENYQLVQTDIESKEIQRDYCNLVEDDYFPYLFVKLDKSGADYKEIYGSDSADLDAYAILIYERID